MMPNISSQVRDWYVLMCACFLVPSFTSVSGLPSLAHLVPASMSNALPHVASARVSRVMVPVVTYGVCELAMNAVELL